MIGLAIVLGYLLGNILTAYPVAYLVKKESIRKLGDGNPGAANVARSLGRKWGILVWAGDVTKVLLAMSLAKKMGIDGIFILTLVGVSAILGHCYPIFFRFQGGKGIACMGATVLFIMPKVFPLAIILWFLIQRINPRSLTLVIQALVVFLLAIGLVYPKEAFFPLVGSVFLLVGTGMLVNLQVLREMKL
ncbi:MAG: glycerol-3-phosphate acyltransferase [Candidatus Omnitrophica bacterium]|nr:glycerol-3-phosphate acyltransferase [Candidatus Omnitrophota bacterium]